jgi:hypothetical protein
MIPIVKATARLIQAAREYESTSAKNSNAVKLIRRTCCQILNRNIPTENEIIVIIGIRNANAAP